MYNTKNTQFTLAAPTILQQWQAYPTSNTMPQMPSYPMQSTFPGLAPQRTFQPVVEQHAIRNVQLTMPSKPVEELKKPEVARKRNSKEQMTEIMRNMHKERVMLQLHQNFEAHSVHFNVKPDYAGLLSKKFSSFLEEASEEQSNLDIFPVQQKADDNQSNKNVTNSDDEEEESSVPSLARGRKLQEAACLRITRIEKVLASRTDLSMAERRSLRARKNTANFRERRKIANELKHFHTVELDDIMNCLREQGVCPFPSRTLPQPSPEKKH